jgi:hypothetical protein
MLSLLHNSFDITYYLVALVDHPRKRENYENAIPTFAPSLVELKFFRMRASRWIRTCRFRTDTGARASPTETTTACAAA